MPNQGPLDFLPLWALFLTCFAFVLLLLAAGIELGRRRSAMKDPESATSVGAMANASLALLAFLLAFTFGLAAQRFDARRTVLLDEVNAIGTTYLRTSTLPDAEGAPARAKLREYVDVRLEAATSGDLVRGIARSESLQRELWASAAAWARANPESIVAGLYLQTLNEMIDLHTLRVAGAYRVRIPAVIWIVLAVLSAIGMLEMGYQMGLAGGRRPLLAPAFALAFSAVIFLIADLDRPQAGLIRVSQQPMVELRQSMEEPAP